LIERSYVNYALRQQCLATHDISTPSSEHVAQRAALDGQDGRWRWSDPRRQQNPAGGWGISATTSCACGKDKQRRFLLLAGSRSATKRTLPLSPALSKRGNTAVITPGLRSGRSRPSEHKINAVDDTGVSWRQWRCPSQPLVDFADGADQLIALPGGARSGFDRRTAVQRHLQ